MSADTPSTQTSNAWRSIWWRPQATIKDIVGRNDSSYVLLLAAIAGVNLALALGGSPYIHWFAVLVIALVAGPLAGILQLYVSSALFAWAGRLLGGQASPRTLRAAIAWASVPQMIAAVVIIVAIAVYHQAFLKAYNSTGSDDSVVEAVVLALLLLSVWGFVLLVRTLGAVQHFGVVRSIANILIPVLALLAVVALPIRIFLFEPFVIPASSMVPTLLVGDHVFVSKFSYGYSRHSFPFGAATFAGRIWAAEPKRGDVVVFKLPRDSKVAYIKRVVGLPGDEVQMKNGALVINGVEVAKVRTGEFVTPRDGETRHEPLFTETLRDGAAYSVLDTETGGPLDSVGPYKVPSGHYFVLGDNRDNSVDSRDMKMVGYVPFENLVGRVSAIYFSAGELGSTDTIWNAFENIRLDRFFHVPH